MNEACFTRVYHRHYRAIHVYCRRRVAAESVDDAVAETFLTAWRKLDEMPGNDRELPWLYGIAYRVLMHQWRSGFRRARLTQRLRSLGAAPPSAPDERIIASNESQRVLTAASRLNTTDQEILRLSLWEELSYAEIALSLELNPDAVRQRLSRAVKNLTEEFDRINRDDTLLPSKTTKGRVL